MGAYFDLTHSRDPWAAALSWVKFAEGSGAAAADSTDNAHGLTLVNAPTWTGKDLAPATRQFSTGNGVQLNGTTQRLSNGTGLLNTFPAAGWTLSLLFRFDSPPSGNPRLFSKFQINGTVFVNGLPAYTGIDVFRDAGTGAIKVVIYLGWTGGAGSGPQVQLVLKTTSFATGRIYQLAVRFDAATGYSLILDDVIEATDPTTTNIAAGSSDPLTIGAQSQGGSVANFAPITVGFFAVLPWAATMAELVAILRRDPTFPARPLETRVARQGIIIAPFGAEDQNSCQEFRAWHNPTRGLYQGLVHCGWGGPAFFRQLESADGLSWPTNNGAALGNGNGGESATDVGRGTAKVVGENVVVIYDNGTGAGKGVRYATSPATDGRTFTRQGAAPVIDNASVATYGTRVVGGAYVPPGPNCPVHLLFCQVFGNDGIWRMMRWTGPDLDHMTLDTASGFLTDLQVGDGMYGGYTADLLADGTLVLEYHTGAHGNSPTVERTAFSWDLGKRWSVLPVPSLQLGNELAGEDQVADRSRLVSADGRRLFLYNSVVNNVGQVGRIAAAVFDGTPEEYYAAGPRVNAGDRTVVPPSASVGTVAGAVQLSADAFDDEVLQSVLGAIKVQTDKIANGVNVVGGFVKGNLTIRQGDSYTPTSGQRLKITRPAGATWPADLTGWTVTLTGVAKADVTTAGSKSFTTLLTVVDPAGVQDLYPDALTATSTAGLAPQLNGWEYTIRAVKNSDTAQANTLLSGVLSVAPQLTP